MPRLLLGIFCGACLHAQIPDFSASNRINNMEKTIQELGLNPMVSSQDDVDKAADMLREKGFDGILLIAPSKIDVDSDGGLPLMGFDAYRTTDRAGIGFDYSAVLVATHVESGVTVANSLRKVHEEARPLENTLRQPPGTVMGRFHSDARERLPDIPWTPGRLSLVVLLFDQRSNQARVALTSSKVQGTGAPEQKSKVDVSSVFPPLKNADKPGGAGYPQYRANAGSPPVPEELGVNLVIKPEFGYQPEEVCVLHGSFRLPVAPRYVVQADATAKPSLDAGDPEAKAVIPIALVIMGNKMPGAFVVPLKVPIYDRVDPTVGAGAATGHFSIDLYALDNVPRSPQTYTMWAFAGEVIGGGVTVKFVSK